LFVKISYFLLCEILLCKNFFKFDDQIKFFKEFEKFIRIKHIIIINIFSLLVFFRTLFSFEIIKSFRKSKFLHNKILHNKKYTISLRKINIQVFFQKAL